VLGGNKRVASGLRAKPANRRRASETARRSMRAIVKGELRPGRLLRRFALGNQPR